MNMFSNTIFKRGIHTVPKLPNLTNLTNNGIPKIFSSKGFQMVWNDYQKYLCNKLTLVTAGTDLESYFPFHIVLNTSKKSYQTNIFNIASAAHNNHLFIQNILPCDGTIEQVVEKVGPSNLFLSRVEKSFDKNWETLKDEIISQVDERLVGQGWFFLVENSNKELSYIFVQNNGTPYYFPRNQLFDLNSALNVDEFSQLEDIKNLLSEAKTRNTKIRDWTMPLICVNLWDVAYLSDYGVGNRQRYLENVLDNLNWTVVNKRLYGS